MQKNIANIAVSGFALLVGLLLVEGFLRLFSPLPDAIIRPAPYVSDDNIGYRFKENGEFTQNRNSFYTHSYGFRVQTKEAYPLPSDNIILVIGDSQTFGWLTKTEDTFVVKIQKNLREQGRDVFTINAAAPGWNLWNYIHVLELVQNEYQNIKAVVLYIVDNDWESGDKFRIEDGYLEDNYKDDAARIIPKIVRVRLNSVQVWRYATRAWQTLRYRGTEDQFATIPNDDLWNDAAGNLEAILMNMKAKQIPLVVIVDEEVAEAAVIMDLLTSHSVTGILYIAEVSGGHLYDGHIDVEKHNSLAQEIVDILIEYLP